MVAGPAQGGVATLAWALYGRGGVRWPVCVGLKASHAGGVPCLVVGLPVSIVAF